MEIFLHLLPIMVQQAGVPEGPVCSARGDSGSNSKAASMLDPGGKSSHSLLPDCHNERFYSSYKIHKSET